MKVRLLLYSFTFLKYRFVFTSDPVIQKPMKIVGKEITIDFNRPAKDSAANRAGRGRLGLKTQKVGQKCIRLKKFSHAYRIFTLMTILWAFRLHRHLSSKKFEIEQEAEFLLLE